MNIRFYLPASVILVLVFFLSACSDKPPVVPASEAKFLVRDSEMVQDLTVAPFDRILVNNKSNLRAVLRTYQCLQLNPVDISFLPAAPSNATSLSTQPTSAEQKDIADYFNASFRNSLSSSKSLWLKLDVTPECKTLVFNAALTELKPTNAAVNATESIATFFIPGSFLVSGGISAGVGAVTGQLTKGSVGMALKLSDQQSNEVLFQAAARRTDPTSVLVNFKSFNRYGNTRKTIDTWSSDLVSFLVSSPDAKFEKASNITIGIF